MPFSSVPRYSRPKASRLGDADPNLTSPHHQKRSLSPPGTIEPDLNLTAHEKEASVHLEQMRVGDQPPFVHGRVGRNYDARNVLNTRKKHKEDGASRGYHPRRGSRYNSEED
jgi:hypothetical protein